MNTDILRFAVDNENLRKKVGDALRKIAQRLN